MRGKVTSLIGSIVVLSIASVAGAQQKSSALAEAAKNRDKQAVRALLNQRADVNTSRPDGTTALHWAAHWDDLEIVDLLIRAGAAVNATDDHGVTPLLLAAENGNAAIVERLLGAGANPNAVLPTGETVLMTAARTGNAEVVKALLARGADVNAKENTQGQTALMWAASEKNLAVVRTLLEHGADIHTRSGSTNGFTALYFAAREGSLDIVRLLVAKGANGNEAAKDGSSPLLVATVRGHVALAKFLLEQGADPNADGAGYTPLHWAAGTWEGELTGVRGIVPPPSGEWTALAGLPGPEKLDFIKALLAHGANPNARAKRTPERFGAGGGPNLVGGTPFLIAAMSADVGLMRFLMENGADPRLTTNATVTPLMVAAGLNRNEESRITETKALEAVKFLVEETGADVNFANNAGDTALHAAAAAAADQLVQYLADKGANLNVTNKRGWSPLTMADGIYVNATFQIRQSTAALLRKLGAAENALDCSIDGNENTIACAQALLKSNAAAGQ